MDYLKNECEKFGINLVYSNNKVLILSSSIANDVPTIRANEIFKNCSEEAAYSIIDYYTNLKRNSNSINIINDFVKLNYAHSRYKIKSPNQDFLNYFRNYSTTLIEYEISGITQNHFYGNPENISPDSSIKTLDDDIIELDIVVKPPAT